MNSPISISNPILQRYYILSNIATLYLIVYIDRYIGSTYVYRGTEIIFYTGIAHINITLYLCILNINILQIMNQQQQPKQFELTLEMLPEIDTRTFRPKGNRLLISPIVLKNLKVGNIFVGDTGEEQIRRHTINKGVVISAGPGIEDKSIEAGSIVYFWRHASGGAFRQGEQELLLFCEYDIIGDIDLAKELELNPPIAQA